MFPIYQLIIETVSMVTAGVGFEGSLYLSINTFSGINSLPRKVRLNLLTNEELLFTKQIINCDELKAFCFSSPAFCPKIILITQC